MRGLEALDPAVRAVRAWVAPARVVPKVAAEPKPAAARRRAAPAVQALSLDRPGLAAGEAQVVVAEPQPPPAAVA